MDDWLECRSSLNSLYLVLFSLMLTNLFLSYIYIYIYISCSMHDIVNSVGIVCQYSKLSWCQHIYTLYIVPTCCTTGLPFISLSTQWKNYIFQCTSVSNTVYMTCTIDELESLKKRNTVMKLYSFRYLSKNFFTKRIYRDIHPKTRVKLFNQPMIE